MLSGLTPIPSHLSSANQFKIDFFTLYNAVVSYANTFTFIKCQSVENQFSHVIQCHQVLHQYPHIYQVPISSKSIFSHYTMPLGVTPIPSCLIQCQSVQNQFSHVIQCCRVLCQYLHIYPVPII